MTTLLVDNYDSFTWNVYQYLSELGANVEVYRNDQVTLEECIALNPRNIVISPGPGRPADAAVSNEVIRHFAGKVPIMGVCLGEQCMYEVYGGKVTYAGEIVHGKTSPVTHDGRGLYEGVPQRIETTRYHSLAGDPKTLPHVLEITSWTDSGVVMGIRHKEFVMEGIQYHPESIASEYGKVMFANFLKWEGGTWDQLKVRSDVVRELDDVEKKGGTSGGEGKRSSPGGGIPLSQVSKLNSTSRCRSTVQNVTSEKGPTILERIRDQRLADIAASRALPGNSDYHLQRSIACGVPLPNIDFPARILQSGSSVAVMAEIKGASPSKGNIDISAHAPTQALLYADGGAAVISVLTEPKWFKGSLEDLRQVRQALNGLPNRPAVLRKDFIVDRYQILEARVYGADTLLLIVAILDDAQLRDLLWFSRQLGMEPLVEVANAEEMRRAVAVGSRVIGVNNRDLHTFTVDMNRTSALASLVPEGTILVALSGITGRADVEKYVSGGAKGVLVGEALMRCSDKRAFIQGLLGTPSIPPPTPATPITATMAKVCGITNSEDALAAAKGGADLIGLIFAKSPRQIDAATAASIVEEVRGNERAASPIQLPFPDVNMRSAAWFNAAVEAIRSRRAAQTAPLFVGVFSNHSVAEINRIVEEVQLDLVQFHSDEPPDLARLIRVPVIKAFHIHAGETSQQVLTRAQEARGTIGSVLLDTAVKGLTQRGGSGETFDWDVAAGVQEGGVPIILAGGLDAKNVREAIERVRPWCVDVSSVVELDGMKRKKVGNGEDGGCVDLPEERLPTVPLDRNNGEAAVENGGLEVAEVHEHEDKVGAKRKRRDVDGTGNGSPTPSDGRDQSLKRRNKLQRFKEVHSSSGVLAAYQQLDDADKLRYKRMKDKMAFLTGRTRYVKNPTVVVCPICHTEFRGAVAEATMANLFGSGRHFQKAHVTGADITTNLGRLVDLPALRDTSEERGWLREDLGDLEE
ncbi:bifunctional tryptophan synthase trp1 [Borealophlyctis nickersoniae]|nr:bifunctional tryptophan synthase trp1 [Borealophlyctis nickersoniae]